MLTLSRKIGETIVIRNGDEVIEIMLTKVKGQQAEISINAPRTYEILREELLSNTK